MQHLMKFQVYPLKDVTLEKEEKLTQKKKKKNPKFFKIKKKKKKKNPQFL